MVPDTLALALYKQTIQNLDEVLSLIDIDTDEDVKAERILKDTRDAYQVLISRKKGPSKKRNDPFQNRKVRESSASQEKIFRNALRGRSGPRNRGI